MANVRDGNASVAGWIDQCIHLNEILGNAIEECEKVIVLGRVDGGADLTEPGCAAERLDGLLEIATRQADILMSQTIRIAKKF